MKRSNNLILGFGSGSHGSEDLDYGRLVCGTMEPYRWLPEP